MLGKLNLTIQADEFNQSRMTEMSYSTPIKLMRPFYLDDIGTAYVYLMDLAGGVLAGDQLHYNICVNPRAHLYLTNTTATKIHPMENGFANIQSRFYIGEHASLEYFPEEVILFEKSKLENDTIVELSSNSVFVFSEIIFMGRKHYGELHKFSKFRTNFVIKLDGKTIIWEKFDISPVTRHLNGLGYMEQNSHYGSMYLYSKENDGKLLALIREIIQGMNEKLHMGCSLHTSGMLIVKALSNNHYSIQRGFKKIWQMIRPILLKEEMPHIRK